MTDAAWQPFDRLARPAAAVAMALADRWLDGSSEPGDHLGDLYPDELIELRRRLQLEAFRHPSEPRGARARIALPIVAAALAAAGLPLTDQPIEPAVQERLGRHIDALHQARRLVAERSDAAAATIERVDAEAAELQALLGDRGATELGGARVDLALLRAELSSRNGDLDGARRRFAEARRLAAALADPVKRREVAKAQATWAFHAAGDTDAALTALAPLLDELAGPADALARAEVEVLLARAQLQAGDAFEARRTAERAAGSLAAAGFPDEGVVRVDDRIAVWATAAGRLGHNQTERLQAFLGAAASWFAVAAVRLQTGYAAAEARLADLQALIETAVARAERVGAADQAALEARWREELPEANLPPSQIAPLPAPDTTLVDRLGALRTRAEAGEATAELIAALDGLVADARTAGAATVEGYALWTRGTAKAAADDVAGAERDLEAAIDLGTARADPKLVVEAAYELALHRLQRQGEAAASAVCGRAIAVVEAHRDRVTPAYLESGFMGRSRHLLEVAVMIAFKMGDAELMLARAELLKARALAAVRRPTEDEASELRRELEAIEANLSATTDPSAVAALRVRRRLLWDRFSVALGKSRPPVFDLGRLQARLGAGTALLAYFFVARDVLLVSLVTATEVRTERLVLAEPDALRDLLDRFAAAQPHTPLDHVLATLRDWLLPETFVPALDAASLILVSAHQVLHQLPVHALPWGTGYLIEQKPVAYVPNLSCLLQDGVDPPRSPRLFAVAADCAQGPGGPSGLPPLPHLDAEMDAVLAAWEAAGMPATALVGSEASCGRFRAAAAAGELSRATVLHLALHGGDVAAADVVDTPMETSLHLFDGSIDGLELARLRLDGAVVVMAACHAGKRAVRGRGFDDALPADTAYGLQAAMHAAGARAIVGALWEAHDRTSAELLPAVHAALLTGASAPLAVQVALQGFLGSASRLRRRPGYWAWCMVSAFTPAAAGLATGRG